MIMNVVFLLACVAAVSVVSAVSSNGSTYVKPKSKSSSNGEDNKLSSLPGYSCLKEWQGRFDRTLNACGFENVLQGAITTGVCLDFFNGLSFMAFPRVASAVAGLPNVPGSVSSVIGSAFLSSSVLKAQGLRDGSMEYKKEMAKNQLVPLGALAAYLIATPFSPATTKPLVAFQGIAFPFIATSGLAYANLKASKYTPPKK